MMTHEEIEEAYIGLLWGGRERKAEMEAAAARRDQRRREREEEARRIKSREAKDARLSQGLVYVVQAGGSGAVKIGWARDVEKRIAILQIGCPEPLSLVKTFDGGALKEREMHKRLAEYRLSGEWFKADVLALL